MPSRPLLPQDRGQVDAVAVGELHEIIKLPPPAVSPMASNSWTIICGPKHAIHGRLLAKGATSVWVDDVEILEGRVARRSVREPFMITAQDALVGAPSPG